MLRPAWQERLALTGAALGLVVAVVLAGSWADVLPGGWRLRSLVEAHDARAARERALHAAARLSAFANEERQPAAESIVFVGSSTIERCPLAVLFPGVHAVNRGIDSAHAHEMSAHLDRLIEGDERAVVLYAGAADRLDAPLDAAGVLRGIAELAANVRGRAPETPVLLLGLLPSTRTRAAEAQVLAQIDAGIARIARDHGFQHVNFQDSGLVGPDLALKGTLSSDGLHLNQSGYEIFAERLRSAPEPFASFFAG